MKELIALEVERGDEALKSAETLLSAGLYRDAMSRTYYAVPHYARALLATKGCFPITESCNFSVSISSKQV